MENILTQSLITILERDLKVLEKEINLYPDEPSIWKLNGEIKNTAGNLCLHLCGNLQHYIGAVLGNSGYVRNRDNEFAARGISRKELVDEIGKTIVAIKTTLPLLSIEMLEKEYPAKVFDYPMTTTYFLVHLSAHLGYHLGQINYHRRILAAQN